MYVFGLYTLLCDHYGHIDKFIGADAANKKKNNIQYLTNYSEDKLKDILSLLLTETWLDVYNVPI